MTTSDFQGTILAGAAITATGLANPADAFNGRRDLAKAAVTLTNFAGRRLRRAAPPTRRAEASALQPGRRQRARGLRSGQLEPGQPVPLERRARRNPGQPGTQGRQQQVSLQSRRMEKDPRGSFSFWPTNLPHGCASAQSSPRHKRITAPGDGIPQPSGLLPSLEEETREVKHEFLSEVFLRLFAGAVRVGSIRRRGPPLDTAAGLRGPWDGGDCTTGSPSPETWAPPVRSRLTNSTITGNVVYTSALTNTGSTISGTISSPLPGHVVLDFNEAYAALNQGRAPRQSLRRPLRACRSRSIPVSYCFPAAVTLTNSVLTLDGDGDLDFPSRDSQARRRAHGHQLDGGHGRRRGGV